MVARVTTLTDTVRHRPTLVAARARRGTYAPASLNRSLQIDSTARTTYACDAANQTRYSQDATGRTTFTFDTAGNQRIELSPALARTTNVWDYENRRRAVLDPSTGATTFTYRPDALRVKSQDATSTTKFIWDEQRVLTETDNANAAQVVYTSEPAGYGNLVAQRRLSGGLWTPYVHLYDALGSTDRLTDATQAVANSYVYKAFGVLAASSGSVTNVAQFVGRLGYATQAAGTYVQARWYDPPRGRWLSWDPLWQASLNAFSYTHNAPIIVVDPSGKFPIDLYMDNGGGALGLSQREKDALQGCICGFPKRDRDVMYRKIFDEISKGGFVTGGWVECRDGKMIAIVTGWLDSFESLINHSCGELDCTIVHEEHHIAQAKHLCAPFCVRGATMDDCRILGLTGPPAPCHNVSECFAYGAELGCLINKASQFYQAHINQPRQIDRNRSNYACFVHLMSRVSSELRFASDTYGCAYGAYTDPKLVDEYVRLSLILEPEP